MNCSEQTINIYEYPNLSATVVFSGLGTNTIEFQTVIFENWQLPNNYKDNFQNLSVRFPWP